MAQKILLLDIPNLFYRSFFAVPKTLTSPQGEPINAVFGVASALITLLENHRPDFVFGFRDRKEKTFRHEKEAAYKAQRPEMPSELVSQLPKIDELFATFNIPVISAGGFEADDCIATAAKNFSAASDTEIYIISSDQDLLGLVSDNIFVLRPINGGKTEMMNREKVKEKTGVFPEQIADLKALAGDTSDNLPGVRGIGKKGAVELLNEFSTLEGIFQNLDRIGGKKREILTAEKEQALHTKALVELHCQVAACDVPRTEGTVSRIPWEKVGDYCQRYRFHSLLNRLVQVAKAPSSPKPPQVAAESGEQLSFF